ncbi:hypothetical protein A6U89_31275 [Agrobacterium sp. B133/95]|uniref:Monooxygenase n=1 Tax=Rhizobium rhizogenes (strain K84 / ATCC BAA-868) TaxID=311403 RepID=B9JQ47_RHIR8|nr:monooxygenase [Rhizobium rhizogenes K84]OCJ24127.1 hypothetical protein A6U89_31275 [Agrobacterium sp. B133/95]
MEIGLYTFGDLPLGSRGPAASSRRLSEIIEAAKLADQAGLSVFGIGEHHRLDYTISVPVAVMGAIAAVTKNIRITTAVTILSSSDPVSIFEELATIDLLSAGRGELTLGRGAFIESFPLFGYDLSDYDALYEEKLALLLKIAASDEVTRRGRFRARQVRDRSTPLCRPSSDLGRRLRDTRQRRTGGQGGRAAQPCQYRWGTGALPSVHRSLPPQLPPCRS